MAFCFLNFPPYRAFPALLLDARSKLGLYRLDLFIWRDFLAAWGAHAWHLVLGAALIASFLAAGAAWRAWRPGRNAHEDALLLDLGMGAGLSGLAALGLGFCGLLFPATVVLLLAAGVVCAPCRRAWWRFRAMVLGNEFSGAGSGWPLAALAAMGMVCLLMALAPESGWDPAYYHLRLPKLYSMQHKIFFVAHIYPSHYPQAIEMLYLLAWLPGGEGAAKLLNFAFWALCGFAVLRLASPLGRPCGLVAATLALTLPLSGTLASENYIDLGLTFFMLLALKTAWAGDPLAAGLLLGFVMGSKYTGILAAAALGTAMLSFRVPLARIVLLAAASALPVIPWLARNFFFTGDPVAPFFFGQLGKLAWAGGVNQSAMVEVIPKMSHPDAAAAAKSLLTGLYGFLQRPWFGIFSPFVLGMFPVLALRWHGYGGYLRVFVLVFTGLVLLVAPDGRYWQPAVMPLCVLVAVAWRQLGKIDRPVLFRSMQVLAAGSVAFGIVFHAVEMHSMFSPFLRALGLEPAFYYDDRLLQPAPWYARAVRRLNSRVPKNERVAVISDVQAYELNRRALFDCDQVGAKRWIWEITRLRTTEEDIARQFRQWKARTVFVIRPKARALIRGEDWRGGRGKAWAAFWNSRARLAYETGDCAIYELDPLRRKAEPKLDLPGPQDWAGVMWGQERDPAVCASIYRGLLAGGIESAGIHADFGRAMAWHGRDTKAATAFGRALAVAPEIPGLWFVLARFHLDAGRPREARSAFERGIRLDPDSPEASDLPRRLQEAEIAAPGSAPDKLVR